MKHCYKSESCQFLGVGILDQPVIELDGLHKVLNRNSLVKPMESLCIILGDKGWSEPGDCQCDRMNVSALLPVDLVDKMLIVLRIRVGYEGARSNVAFWKHLIFCHWTFSSEGAT